MGVEEGRRGWIFEQRVPRGWGRGGVYWRRGV